MALEASLTRGGTHTCDALLGPVLQTNPVVLSIVDLFTSCTSVEDTLALARNGLGEMAKPIPLAALF